MKLNIGLLASTVIKGFVNITGSARNLKQLSKKCKCFCLVEAIFLHDFFLFHKIDKMLKCTKQALPGHDIYFLIIKKWFPQSAL
jgi:hypothetical protein